MRTLVVEQPFHSYQSTDPLDPFPQAGRYNKLFETTQVNHHEIEGFLGQVYIWVSTQK